MSKYNKKNKCRNDLIEAISVISMFITTKRTYKWHWVVETFWRNYSVNYCIHTNMHKY